MPEVFLKPTLPHVLTALIVVAGCSTQNATPDRPQVREDESTGTVSAEVSTAGRLAEDEEAPDQINTHEPDAEQTRSTPAGEHSDSEGRDDSSAISAQMGRERFALLLPGGPLVVELWLSIHERPHTEGTEKLVEHVLAAGDVDKDGRATWKELTTNQKFLYGPVARLDSDPQREARQWIERFDADRDGRIQAVEVRSWLGRDGRQTWKPLAMRSHESFSASPRDRSRTWRLLDRNRDGVLSMTEIDQTSLLLLSFDADDNYIIQLRELESLREQARTSMATTMRRRPPRGRHGAIMLDHDRDWYRIWYLVSNHYAPRGDLSASSFSLFPNLFGELDGDSDGKVDDAELEALTSQQPHLVVKAAFGSSTNPDDYRPTLEVVETEPNIGNVTAESSDRFVLTLGDNRIVFTAHDLLPDTDIDQTVADRFGAFDIDENGEIDLTEAEAGEFADPKRFRSLDADESGTISAAEMADSVWLEQAVAGSQLRLMIHDQGDSVFRILDSDADGRLEEREIDEAVSGLKSLDQDGDRIVSPRELPNARTVALIRGEDQNERSFYVPAMVRPARQDSFAPNWFVQSDSNQDGEISRREFVGNDDHFRRLDANSDRFIDSTEAQSVD